MAKKVNGKALKQKKNWRKTFNMVTGGNSQIRVKKDGLFDVALNGLTTEQVDAMASILYNNPPAGIIPF